MKKLAYCVLPLMLVVMSGCSMGNGGIQPMTPEKLAPSIEKWTELAATIAFARDDVKEYKPVVCEAVTHVSMILDDYDDPAATFDKVRGVALNAIKDIEHPMFGTDAKRITVLVVDQVMDIVFMRVETKYRDLIEKDQARTVLTVTKALSAGISNACMSDASISSYEVE